MTGDSFAPPGDARSTTSSDSVDLPQIREVTAEALRDLRLETSNHSAARALLPMLLASLCYAGYLSLELGSDLAWNWFGVVATLIAGRGLLVWGYFRSAKKHARFWVWSQAIMMGLVGACYGISVWWLAPSVEPGATAVAAVWITGLFIGVLMGQGIVSPVVIAFSVFSLVPLVIALFASTVTFLQFIGVGLVLFTTYSVDVICQAHRTTLEEARQRMLHEATTACLRQRNSEREALVRELSDEIERRKKTEGQLEQARRAAERLSERDQLTGLPNRRVFERVLQREWSLGRHQQRPISLVLLDIDRFSSYNDRYGHHAGDTCLSRVSEIIRQHIFRIGDLLARYGGEEFVVLLPDTAEHAAMDIAESIRGAVADRTILHGDSDVESYVTVSCGVATMIPNDQHDWESLVESAANALLHAKRAGRNCVYLVYRADEAEEETEL